jgi:hypothetical protein
MIWLLLLIFTGTALALFFILKIVPAIYLLLAVTEERYEPEDSDPAVYKKAAFVVFILCTLLIFNS